MLLPSAALCQASCSVRGFVRWSVGSFDTLTWLGLPGRDGSPVASQLQRGWHWAADLDSCEQTIPFRFPSHVCYTASVGLQVRPHRLLATLALTLGLGHSGSAREACRLVQERTAGLECFWLRHDGANGGAAWRQQCGPCGLLVGLAVCSSGTNCCSFPQDLLKVRRPHHCQEWC